VEDNNKFSLPNQNKTMKSIGKKIKAIREKRGMSQLDLAFYSNLQMSYISQIENGKRLNVSLFVFMKICHVLEIEIQDLL